MSSIHPTSYVDSAIQLSEDVVIGPYCVLEGDIQIGPRTHLMSHVTLCGPMTIGADNTIYPFVSLGHAPQDLSFTPRADEAGTRIGDHNIFREGVSVHRATGDQPTTMGNHNMLMAQSHLAHDVQLGNHCTLVNGALIAGHALIADHVLLSGHSAVHQFCQIGRMAMIAGLAGINQDLPPFCTVHRKQGVGGLNLVGLRRQGFKKHIRPLRQAFDILYRQQHTNPQAVELIEATLGDDPLCLELAEFVKTAQRGITPYLQSAST